MADTGLGASERTQQQSGPLLPYARHQVSTHCGPLTVCGFIVAAPSIKEGSALANYNLATERPKLATAAELKGIISAEKSSLIANWLGERPGQITVGLASRYALKAAIQSWRKEGYTQKHIRNRAGNDYHIENAFALVKDAGAAPECWVRGSENRYRIIYHDFLTQYCNFRPDMRILSRYHVDHVLARTRAKKLFPSHGRFCYLRVTIAPERSNIGAGRIYERFAPERDLRTTSQWGEAFFNFPLALKAFDLPVAGNRDYGDAYVVEACTKMFKNGLLPDSALDIPYAVIRNIFMRASIHPAIDNSVSIVSGNHILTMGSSLREWIECFPQSPAHR